ncbi:protein-methionine-sulfoxide reductase heme-binding subunit MsrQ [Ruegeria atlantica]|uniref:Protein-methionine-sulfoxide reductase heme-binding subunit MsrQ n=1 Tax=Ruegeria atlantica TaxID=81569 RepID=A0A0P1EG02_9RHOB|nr:protein-methionine-sulfoxide reductase heme-binding subunit MsrQ [Ruegeria atlantica]CUH49102.1 Flavocytochrome YedZ [Ruegeria atlantica]
MQTLNQILRRIPVWLVYFLGALPAPWLFYQGLTGGLGVDPIEALEHRYGELALQLLIVVLAISPLRRFFGLNLLKFRRALGVLTFAYVSLHLLVWLVLDVQLPSQIWADILKRPYITVGMAAFILMMPLAVTSNNLSLRKLGARWRILQRLAFPAAILGGLHYVMLSKGFQIEPLVYLSLIVSLILLRIPVSGLLTWFRATDSA